MKNVVRRLAACCLLLFAIAGSLVAQNDKPYVLKRQISGTDHYLSHVNSGGTWTLQDATSFNPETCIWYSGPVFNVSGTHHNYYFIESVDGQPDKYHFLSAPLAANQDLGFSADLPTSSHLKNPDEEYYFYDWDWDDYGSGVARGYNDNGEWSTYWVEYNNEANNWKTSVESYNITANTARFREVTVTEHEKYFNWTQSNISDLQNFSMNWDSDPASNGHALSIIIGSYSYTCTPAYTTYNFEGDNYNFHEDQFLGINVTPTPSSPISGSSTAASYTWTITGEGAEHLSFSSTTESNVLTSNDVAPTLYYTIENTQGRKTAILTLTMTFGSDENIATVVRTAIVTVNTQCQNPAQASAPVILHNDVTVSWYPTATQYKVEWKKTSESSWSSAEVGNVTSYTIYNLDQVEYQYRVIAYCGDAYLDPPANPTGTFTPEAAPHLLIYGSVFGGGRAANVTGKTEVEIVNCDSIGAVYGGNDIAGSAGGNDGSVITLGVNGSGTSATILPVKIGSVYGGGNGYYAYGSTTFTPATASTSTISVGDKVYAMSLSGQWTDSVWANSGTTAVPLPTITKTSITVASDYVKVDSLFGGAKNAFVTKDRTDQNDVTTTNTMTTVNNGTIFAMFGGNNVGGTLGTARQKINVTNTKKDLVLATGTVDLGRTHGIGYLFGGGNLVAGTTTDINITGGQLDTIFGGGNRASVNEAWLTVNCAGSNRISSAVDDDGNILSDYGWDGNDIYNVHTLFGGNNRADMNGVPHITLTSGGVGTAYGGGNAGDMLEHIEQTLDDTLVKYGTHMVLEEDEMIVDFLYGGCQMSNVDYSTWVEIKGGHVGTVYGGCNVSGDVGSKRLDPSEPAFNGSGSSQTPNPLYQEVQGATYVKVTGGTVYRDVYAGSNGYYHCNDGVNYVSGMNYGDPDGSPAEYDPEELYIGLPVPTHNETNVKIQGGHIKGNVYAGGNLACVGFTDYTIPQGHISGEGSYPQFVGMSFVEMSAGVVDGDVYGGGKMASVFGSNSVHVSGGTIHGALYGGNDRTGQVAQITNRVLPPSYGTASDGATNLNGLNVKTYVKLTGTPSVNTVYGGGNGDYIYEGPNAIQFCGITPDEPIQSNTFVDVNIDGGTNGGHIGMVYGGGNGVTVINGITVLLNVNSPDYANDSDHVGVIFGGNNKGSLTLIPDIILLKGKVNTVYGGCNKGAMYGDYSISTGDSTYRDVGSLVRLRNEYKPNGTGTPIIPTAQVTSAVYGGCRMNGVTNNSMVIVEGHESNHINAEIFGGSDISGVVGGTSMVVVNGVDGTEGTYLDNVYGGGNGNYKYQNNNVYYLNDDGTVGDLIDEGTATNPIVAPYCAVSRVDMLSGTANNIYAGGYAALSGSTLMNIVGGTVNNRAFGGGNLAGTTTTFNDGTNSYTANGNSNVMVTGGTVNGGVFGGNNLAGSIAGTVNVDILGGTFGSSSTPMADGIFGGGYGEDTETNGDVVVNINKLNVTGAVAPIIYGDVYGGSALGSVNTSNNDNTTTINVLDGFIKQTNSGGGNIYGGGLGQKNGYNGATSDILAKVYGKVYVNIGAGNWNTTLNDYDLSGNATIEGSVYGCNNVNGSPQDSVFVNIYKTAHISSPNNYYPDNVPTPTQTVAYLESLPHAEENFAIKAVYGGGNMAAYLPPLTSDNKPRCSTVHIYGCSENTVYDVYGGGNAADVGTTGANGIAANTRIIIDGGRIHRMFGGGNGYSSATPPNHDDPTAPGYNPGANIYGTASSYVHAGLIDEVYGGANMWGSIDYIDLNLTGEGNCEHEVFGKVFGCANAAPLNHSITTTVECGVGTIGQLYGGSFQAPIGDENNPNANVTLNVYGGVYNQVFGGSKGKNDSSGSVAADIYGNVTLNIFGGTIHDAFGGSDINGTIAGVITVNVLDLELECPLDITNIYGANNLTAYTSNPVSGALPISPVVNVMHVKTDIHGNVYGGAYGADATVTSSPQVNIGYDATTMSDLYTTLTSNAPANYSPTFKAYVTGNVYGGGELAAVVDDATAASTTTVNLLNVNARVQNIFGGGHQAGTANNVVNVINGTVATAVYGGCDAEGTVTGDIEVNILNNLGTPGEDGYTVNVFGGGYGVDTETDGDVTVNFGGTGYLPTLYGNVYGGSALGSVNSDTDDLTKVDLKTGTIHGVVYGGGLGDIDQDVEAYVYGNVEVYANGAIVDTIFGCNDQNGTPTGTVKVTVNDGTVSYVFGGGDLADYTPTVTSSGSGILYSPYVYVTGGTVTDMIFGGGNAADINGNTKVELIGGTIGSGGSANPASIFGGGYGAGTQVNGHVLVNFGGIFTDNATGDEVHTNDLILYGDLYGGSALGDVNTPNGTDGTTVNILNGIINGRVFGGGLGRKAATGVTPIAARVNGDVQVNIGACNGHGCQDEAYDQTNSTYYTGMADLINCDVFGCNNINGSPQDEVRVDVYKTYHGTEGTNPNGAYAINQVFGGGNESDYLYNVNNILIAKNVNVRIHACDNTIWRTFGGGNAADVYGVKLVIEGGRFEYVFGGGNGEVTAANVGVVNTTTGGGVTTILGGGTISQWFTGSNMNGEIVGGITSTVAEYCGNALVEDYFLGSNMTDYHGDVVATIECDANMPKFVNLYGGCNRAQFYGNIQIDINGGVFYNVFGGSKGWLNDGSTNEESYASNILDYDNGSGTGGNITINVYGGTIGNLFGACNLNGNVQGKITINVEADETNLSCPLYLGNIYGGGNMTDYKPGYGYVDGNYTFVHSELYDKLHNGTINSPEINVKKGRVGGIQTVMQIPGYSGTPDPTTGAGYLQYEGNVYGGGNKGDVEAHPIVKIGDKDHPTDWPVTIEGNVYGGGREGEVVGNTKVVIVPTE